MRHSARLPSQSVTYVEWNDETQVLKITFGSGQSYDYNNVPQDVYEGMVNATSPGSYFHRFIKGQY